MTKSLPFILLFIVLPFHDFHVSHTTLHYNTRQKSIEITVRVAIEDLEKTLELLKPSIDFCTQLAASNNRILFVGTKRAASRVIKKKLKDAICLT